MGWLHVARKGKGIYLPFKYDAVMLKNLNISKEVFELYSKGEEYPVFDDLTDNMDKAMLIILADDNGYLYDRKMADKYKSDPKGRGRTDWTRISKEDLHILAESYKNDGYMYEALFARVFEYENSYPFGSFVSINDYNGDNMFYCSADFPFPEGDKYDNLRSLTEEKYKEQLEEFFSKLKGERVVFSKIEICEEYVKE